jgi:predicted nucleic acid-binding protein
MQDAQLAALAIEYGVPVVSNDSDFARFPRCAWINPVA